MLEIPWSARQSFGIEYEFTRLVSQQTLAAAVRHALPELPDRLVEIRDWEHNQDNEQWMVKRDGSCGWEVITPRMTCLPEDWDQASRVLDACREAGAQVSDRCGTHIHFGDQGFNEDRMARVLAQWIRMEGMIFWTLPRKRRANQFCLSLSRAADLRPGRQYRAQDLLSFAQGNRYRALNLCPWFEGKHRFEFRVIEATLSSKDVWNWSAFLLYFIHRAKSTEIPETLAWYDLEEALRWLGWYHPEDQQEFSEELAGVRDWWLRRLIKYASIRQKHHECRRWAREFLRYFHGEKK